MEAKHLMMMVMMMITDEDTSRLKSIVTLYGEDEFPDDLMEIFNSRMGHLEHATEANDDREVVQCRCMVVLRKHILFLEEKPTVTRFWTFSRCFYGFGTHRAPGAESGRDLPPHQHEPATRAGETASSLVGIF